jgi:hypothetical protein
MGSTRTAEPSCQSCTSEGVPRPQPPHPTRIGAELASSPPAAVRDIIGIFSRGLGPGHSPGMSCPHTGEQCPGYCAGNPRRHHRNR